MKFGEEALRAIYGVWQVALGRVDVSRYFNLSVDGFWRSFLVAFILFPLLLPALFSAAGDGAGASTQDFMALVAAYAFGWVAYPLAMVGVSALLGCGERYAAYVIVYNWGRVLVTAVQLPLILLSVGGLVDISAIRSAALLVQIAIYYFQWRIIAATLKPPLGGALAVMVVYFLLVDAMPTLLVAAMSSGIAVPQG